MRIIILQTDAKTHPLLRQALTVMGLRQGIDYLLTASPEHALSGMLPTERQMFITNLGAVDINVLKDVFTAKDKNPALMVVTYSFIEYHGEDSSCVDLGLARSPEDDANHLQLQLLIYYFLQAMPRDELVRSAKQQWF